VAHPSEIHLSTVQFCEAYRRVKGKPDHKNIAGLDPIGAHRVHPQRVTRTAEVQYLRPAGRTLCSVVRSVIPLMVQQSQPVAALPPATQIIFFYWADKRKFRNNCVRRQPTSKRTRTE
jgi:hypothetical protein